MPQLEVTKAVIMLELNPFRWVSGRPDIEIFGFFYESLNTQIHSDS
jgi:hypothetical protein